MKKITILFSILIASISAFAATTLQITMSSANQGDKVLQIVVDNPFSNADDNGYDAVVGAGQQGGLYVVYNSDRYTKYYTNELGNNLPLGFGAVEDSEYTFNFSYFTGTSFTIYDKKLDKTITVADNILVNGVAADPANKYTFSIEDEEKNTAINDRFVINYVAPTPDYGSYQRNVTVGNYGTICLPKAGTIAGATLFNIGSYENDMIYIDEVGSAEMEAGKPYIFEASADQIIVTYSSDVEVAAGEDNGLHGYFDADNYFVVPADAGNYILRSNQYWEVVSGQHIAYLNNYFAFIKISEINNQAPAPGRRRVGMAVNGAQVVTGIDELNAAEAPVKKFIDGKMYIIRGEHMFDATGRMVK